jgi:hypothetical protein
MNWSNINDIIWKINNLILDNNLEKIIEMTYSYKELWENKFFNITLFSDFWWFDIKDNNQYKNIESTLKIKINNIIKQIDELILELKNGAFDLRWEILYKSLVYIKKILNIVDLWLIFELEKLWLKYNKTDLELENIVKEIEKIEEENFWLKIKNNLSEIKLIHHYLFSLFVDRRKFINSDEQIFFLNYINRINNFLDKQDLVLTKIKKKKNKFNFWWKKIKRDDYIKLFNYILENIYWLEQRAIITDASSIYDWDIYLEIPNKETHEELTYKRVLELIVHEIESHYINAYNNKIILWKFRWARNLEKEEWLAKVMEAFLLWDTVDTMEFIPTYMAKILYSEISSWDDFYKFLEIYNKMYTLRRKPTNEFLRQKRNYSLRFSGGQHKDISYWRWMIKTRDYLKNWGDFSLLFMWKVWFEDLNKLDKLYLENIDNIVFPIFIWDIIQLHLQFIETWSKLKLDVWKIADYLEKKYDFKWIKRFNLRINIWNKIKQIEKLLNFIDKLETNEE